MSRADKTAAIAELAEKFRNSNATVLTEYRGLSVKQITDLRGALRGNATYAVVKNTLTELAAKEAGVTAFDGQLVGPSAIAFVD
ncbi:MAG: 50S ribosomal protein L10, partial [Knoellia sp.]